MDAATISYLHTDVPEGLTLDEWRRMRARPPRRVGARVRALFRVG